MRITITTKVNEEEYEEIKRSAEKEGKSLSSYIKGRVVGQDEWSSGIYDEMLEEIASKVKKDAGGLVSIMNQLIENKFIYLNENERLMIRNLSLPDDELSVDLQIDLLKISAKEKSEIKRKMIKEIPSYNRDDEEYYAGNGAGL